MRVLLLNGALGPDPLLETLAARVQHDLEVRGAQVDAVLLRIESIAWCQGCFDCWTKTPGLCKIDDDGRELATAFANADAVVLITPSRFGSYTSEIKKLLDRTISLLLPFFRTQDGESHHQPRYVSRPVLGVLGVLERPDFDETATLRVLAQRNAVNLASPAVHTAIVARTDATAVQLVACDALVDDLFASTAASEAASSAAGSRSRPQSRPQSRRRIRHPDQLLPAMARRDAAAPPQRVLALVGSAKPRGTSTSEALAMELLERLAVRGVPGALRPVVPDARDTAGLARLTDAVRAADLLLIASPVYLDALPWLLTRALEAIRADRETDASRPPLAVAMLLNCGFPEARHAAVARTIGALFARDIGATWAGALQLGGGGLVHGQTIAAGNPLLARMVPALDDAADSLARGERLTDFAVDRIQEPLLAPLAYRAIADAGWLWTAAHEGALGKLWERPASLV